MKISVYMYNAGTKISLCECKALLFYWKSQKCKENIFKNNSLLKMESLSFKIVKLESQA